MTDSPIDAHPPDLDAGTHSLSEPAAQQRRVEDDPSPDERRAWAITEARLRADLAEAKLDAAEVTRLPEITSLGPAEPVRFEDCLGRHWKWPFHRCRYWSDAKYLIDRAFEHKRDAYVRVSCGHFDLVGPDGECILRDCWHDIVEPGMAVKMWLWTDVGPSQVVAPAEEKAAAAEEKALTAHEPLLESIGGLDREWGRAGSARNTRHGGNREGMPSYRDAEEGNRAGDSSTDDIPVLATSDPFEWVPLEGWAPGFMIERPKADLVDYEVVRSNECREFVPSEDEDEEGGEWSDLGSERE